MPATLVAEELEWGQKGGLPPAGGPADPGGEPGGPARGVPARAYFTGMSLGLAGIFMFFSALVSSYIVRKADAGWQAVPISPLLWANTVILLASSVTLERARGFLQRMDGRSFARWWGVTTALGLLFLGGQVIAWRQLVARGVYVSSNPASSFFYLLTGAHGLHLLGGVVALLYIAARNWSDATARTTQATAAEVAAVYWHFMDGLWVFLLLILWLGK
jgi:cytochrome c oxidase subunit 3